MSDSIKIDNLAAEINRLVGDYGKQCAETTKECVHKVAKKTVSRIKRNSPVRKSEHGGKYKKGWKKNSSVTSDPYTTISGKRFLPSVRV